MSLVLHLHPLSSYCWKVLIGLYQAEIPFTPAMLNPGDPEAREAFVRLWPTAKIPLLEDRGRGRIVPETTIILEYLDTHHRGAIALLPEDADARLEARLWDRLFDLYVNDALGAVVLERIGGRDGSPVDLAKRGVLRTAYGMIEKHMAERQWAAGGAFSIADCAAAPALFYAAIIEPAEDYPNLMAYRERLLALPSVARAIDEAGPYFEYFPFKERLPDRYRPA